MTRASAHSLARPNSYSARGFTVIPFSCFELRLLTYAYLSWATLECAVVVHVIRWLSVRMSCRLAQIRAHKNGPMDQPSDYLFYIVA